MGLIPLGLLGWAGWPGVLSPLFLPGRKIIPGRKKRDKVDRHIIGNSLPLMLLNFQRKFCNFFVTALDAIGSSESILRFRSSYKRRGGEEIGYLTGYLRSIVGER